MSDTAARLAAAGLTDERLDRLAMKIAAAMEIHLATSTTTRSKANAIRKLILAALTEEQP